MIHSNKGVDIGLESNEKIDMDGIDFRTEKDKGALLLWVYFSPSAFALTTDTIHSG